MSLPPMARRIVVAMALGALSIVLTSFVSGSELWPYAIGIFLGGVVLVAQFLIDFETTMSRGLSGLSHAARVLDSIEGSAVGRELMELTEQAAQLDAKTPTLVCGLIQSEMTHLSVLLEGLRSGTAHCKGEDRDWMLTLTKGARSEIWATSTTDVDGGRGQFRDGFWASELGLSYQEAQMEAIEQRQVRIRRVFVLRRPSVLHDEAFQRLCRNQLDIGIEVKQIMVPDIPPRWHQYHDFILFDHTVSYEIVLRGTHRRPRPEIDRTVLRLDRGSLSERQAEFEALWGEAEPVPLV
jgi:hypothetical protein